MLMPGIEMERVDIGGSKVFDHTHQLTAKSAQDRSDQNHRYHTHHHPQYGEE